MVPPQPGRRIGAMVSLVDGSKATTPCSGRTGWRRALQSAGSSSNPTLSAENDRRECRKYRKFRIRFAMRYSLSGRCVYAVASYGGGLHLSGMNERKEKSLGENGR